MPKPRRLNVRRNIPITENMIEAGAKALMAFDPHGTPYAKGAADVFKAMVEAYQRTDENFWAKVNKTDTCWLWTGALTQKGYGSCNRGNIATLAHRWSYVLEHGEIPGDLHVLHKCDNPPCVNPAHLYAGTNQQNSDDRVERDRNHPPFGEKHENSKLTDAKVREIRALKHISQYVLAEKYGVSQHTISCVQRRETWRHVK